jgi:hypothetical protein
MLKLLPAPVRGSRVLVAVVVVAAAAVAVLAGPVMVMVSSVSRAI